MHSKIFRRKKKVVADCLSRLRNEPNLLDTLNKLPKITCIDDEVEWHVTTRLQSKFNNAKVDKFLDNSSSSDDDSDDESEQSNKIPKEKDPPLIKYVPSQEEITWSIDELKSEQKRDPFVLEVTIFLKKENCCINLKYDIKDFLYINGILYKKRKVDSRLENGL